MSTLTKVSLTVGALGFLAYCVYFDRKRRSDPNFREKLKAKRAAVKKSALDRSDIDIPIFKDPNDMQAYFMKQVSMSDNLMQENNFEEAVIHLANATVVCSQKSEFLGLMQKTLPPPIFELLMQYYPIANERYVKKILKEQASAGLKAPKQFIDEEDIE